MVTRKLLLVFIKPKSQEKSSQHTPIASLAALLWFSTWQVEIKEKAFRALYTLTKHTNVRKLSLFLATKIFDAMISPILSYDSDLRGTVVLPVLVAVVPCLGTALPL